MYLQSKDRHCPEHVINHLSTISFLDRYLANHLEKPLHSSTINEWCSRNCLIVRYIDKGLAKLPVLEKYFYDRI